MIFRHPIRVYWEDTDAGGIVYHSNYLNFAERARTEMVRGLGLSQQAMMDGQGTVFAVRHMAIDFLRPARLDDALEVESRIEKVGGASMQVAQTIRRLDDGGELVRLSVRLGFISTQGGPARLPPHLRQTLQDLVNEGG